MGSTSNCQFFGEKLVFKLQWRQVAQRRMKAFRIVKGFNVIKKQRLGMIAIERDLVVVETFALESRPKTFHDGVIVTIAFSTHAGFHLITIQELAKVA